MTGHHYNQANNDKTRSGEWESETDFVYVIYLVDSNGEEFFISQQDELVHINTPSNREPLVLKTLFQINAHLGRLRKKYSVNCQLFGLEYGEFLERKAC